MIQPTTTHHPAGPIASHPIPSHPILSYYYDYLVLLLPSLSHLPSPSNHPPSSHQAIFSYNDFAISAHHVFHCILNPSPTPRSSILPILSLKAVCSFFPFRTVFPHFCHCQFGRHRHQQIESRLFNQSRPWLGSFVSLVWRRFFQLWHTCNIQFHAFTLPTSPTSSSLPSSRRQPSTHSCQSSVLAALVQLHLSLTICRSRISLHSPTRLEHESIPRTRPFPVHISHLAITLSSSKPAPCTLTYISFLSTRLALMLPSVLPPNQYPVPKLT
ncbi:hypothetical protein GGR58DRAFT_251006 [Xylaria digitata]|nr:hypothetical protein GGR58DRAFT_251006 [Xylaria digitata]